MKFDESNVINALHTERAVIGSTGFFANGLNELKKHVSTNDTFRFGQLVSVSESDLDFPFYKSNLYGYSLFYPAELPKQKKLVPFTWEDREMLRGKWIRRKDNHECESMINKVFIGIDGNMYINNILATSLLNGWEFLDGKHFGKEVDE